MFGVMFFIILGTIAWISLALWPAFIAKNKGYSFILFLLLGVFVSFILALIVAALLKDKTLTPEEARAVDKALHEQEGIDI